jgi:2,3-bisphosphoglycerate-dependent phosphoglycerate mutase
VTETTAVPTIRLENPFAPLTGLCELVMVRHGEQQLSRETSVEHAVDAPLSELGLRQVEEVGKRLAAKEVHAIYSSPLRRAFETGEAIGRHHGLVPQAMDELREFHPWLGLEPGRSIHDLLSREEVRGIFREHIRTKKFDAFPYAEDRHLFRDRINTALAGIIDRHLGQRVVVTCHGGVINALLAAVVGSDQDLPVRVHHTSISVFRGADTRRSVISVNDFTHVLDLQDSINPFNL